MCLGPCRTLWIPLGFLFTHTTLCSIVEAGLPLFLAFELHLSSAWLFYKWEKFFFAYYCVPRKSSTSCNNGLPTIFLGKARSEIFCTTLAYLSDYASNGMSLLQVYLNPFPDAFLDGIFGTPGSSKFVVIESVNWKRVLFFQNQFEEKKGKADTGFSPLLSILAKPDMWYLRRNLKDESIL